MSASFIWIAWCCAIGLPKVSRSCAYVIAASNAARATPTARAAMLMRPTSSAPRMKCWPATEALVAAEHAVGGDAVAVVDHLDGLDALVAELADVAAHGDAADSLGAGLLLDDEAGDALVGAGRQRDQPGALPVRDPHLRAGDHVLVAVAHGPAA